MKYFVVMIFMALIACSTPVPEQAAPVVIQREAIDRPPLNLPPVGKITARDVEWTIVTPENVDQIFAEMTARGEATALFSVNETGYENLAINTQEALRVIVQQQAVIAGYRVYYIQADGTIAAYNSSQ
jgi:hypothetical protein